MCESFVDNGECVEYCPPAYIYNEHTHRYEPNPDVKYEHSVLCVESCPGLITVYICPIAIAYHWTDYKITCVISVCVCVCVCHDVCVSVRHVLTVAIFKPILTKFGTDVWNLRWGSKSNKGIPYFYPILPQIGPYIALF